MKKVIIAVLAFAPMVAFAQSLQNIEPLVSGFGRLVDLAIPIVVGLAVLAFFWGLVKFIFAQGNEEAKSSGKQIMLWGLIAIFVVVSIFGIIQFFRTSLGIGSDSDISIPTLRP